MTTTSAPTPLPISLATRPTAPNGRALDPSHIAKLQRQIAAAQKREQRARGIVHAPGIPGTLITGNSGVPASRRRALDRQLDRVIDNAVVAVKAGSDAEKLERELALYKAGRVNEQGRSVQSAREKSNLASATEWYAAYVRSRVKRGDRVEFLPNPDDTGSLVLRLNRKTVTLEGGSTWEYTCIRPMHTDGSRMTGDEVKADFKAFRDAQNEEVSEVSNDATV